MRSITYQHNPAGIQGTCCDYYGNTGSNRSGCYCQNTATWDLGRHMQIAGLPYEVRFSCTEHEGKLVPFKYRKAEKAKEDSI